MRWFPQVLLHAARRTAPPKMNVTSSTAKNDLKPALFERLEQLHNKKTKSNTTSNKDYYTLTAHAANNFADHRDGQFLC
jgi:hypothetical protein